MGITHALGFRAASVAAQIKPSGKTDVVLVTCEGRSPSAAAVFTTSQVVGAPIELGRAWRELNMDRGGEGRPLRGLLINAGNSNSATGEQGVADARACTRAVAEAMGCEADQVLPSSTGVIGHRLQVSNVVEAVPGLMEGLGRGMDVDEAAAQAIRTTDSWPKHAKRTIEIDGHTVRVGGIGKGAGMIEPRMDRGGGGLHGTMLAFLTTDAAVDRFVLQQLLDEVVDQTFNHISVDAHQSCSDTAVLLASGESSAEPITDAKCPAYEALKEAVREICDELAREIVRDGEGATRVFRIDVIGAGSDAEAGRIAREVVNSPLVKCAVHGKDPNWGRIVTAAGNAGVRFDVKETSLTIGGDSGHGGVEVYRAGVPVDTTGQREALAGAMGQQLVRMELRVGGGEGRGWMLGCDLTNDYVRINSLYTT